MCCGLALSILYKLAFIVSGIAVVSGCVILWDLNVWNLGGYALDKYNYDIFMFIVSWGFCFIAWLTAEDAFIVLTAGVLLACVTTRQNVMGDANLVSFASVNMCREFASDPNHPANTASIFNPEFDSLQLASNNTYSYSVSERDAQLCVVGGALVYIGMIAGLVSAAFSGKGERDKSGTFMTRLLSLVVLVCAFVGSTVVFTSEVATLSLPTYFNVVDVTAFVLLTSCCVALSYFVNSVPMVYASSVLAAYAAMINLSEMFATNRSTKIEITNVQSGFILNELSMAVSCILCIWSAMAGFQKKTTMKIVPIRSASNQ